MKRLWKHKTARHSTITSLQVATSVPDSGFDFVNNSQGASTSIIELSKALDDVLGDIEIEGSFISSKSWTGISCDGVTQVKPATLPKWKSPAWITRQPSIPTSASLQTGSIQSGLGQAYPRSREKSLLTPLIAVPKTHQSSSPRQSALQLFTSPKMHQYFKARARCTFVRSPTSGLH